MSSHGTTLALPAHLTLGTAQEVLAGLSAGIAAASGPTLALDAQALTQIDTSTLAVLLECQRRAQARQLSLTVLQPPARLVELAQLYGVQDLLTLQA